MGHALDSVDARRVGVARLLIIALILLGCQSSISPERPYPLSATIYYVRPLCGLEVERTSREAEIQVRFKNRDRFESIVETRLLTVHISLADFDALQRYCSRPKEKQPVLETALSR